MSPSIPRMCTKLKLFERSHIHWKDNILISDESVCSDSAIELGQSKGRTIL